MQGNTLAVLGWQMRDFTLFVQKLPVDSSTLGVVDHHLGCCCCIGTHVSMRGNYDSALISSLVVEPSFLARVCEATWDSPDAQMRNLARRARENHA